MPSNKTGKRAAHKIEGTRSDKRVECYPTLGEEALTQIDGMAQLRGLSRSAMAADIAHHCLWSERVLSQLQPYLQAAVALTWDVDPAANVFHCWVSPRVVRDLRPCLSDARADGQRVKFRISQVDRHRLQVLAFALGRTSADALWPVLFGLALTDGRSLYALTRVAGVAVHARHPLTGEWIHVESEGIA